MIAGEALGVSSKVLTKTPICYLDFTLEPGAEHIQTVPKGWNSFAYVVQVRGDTVAFEIFCCCWCLVSVFTSW